MADASDDLSTHPIDRRRKRRASGIYGAIITAAILAALGDAFSTDALVVAVIVTLVVYWLAEEYAHLLAEQTEDGHLPTWPHVTDELGATWPMVAASFLPLLALVLTRVFGGSQSVSVNVALTVAVVLILFYAWTAGRAAKLRGAKLFVMIAVAAALGIAMIILKNLVLLHLH